MAKSEKRGKKIFYSIGIIADTHNRWLPRVGEIFAEVDEIWHLGDVCEEKILDELRLINPKVEVVLGNNDEFLDYPLSRQLQRGKERFYLTHILPRHFSALETDWILFGHTHVPCNEMEQGIRLFNPGSAGRASKGAPLSVGILTQQEEKGFFSSKIILLD